MAGAVSVFISLAKELGYHDMMPLELVGTSTEKDTSRKGASSTDRTERGKARLH